MNKDRTALTAALKHRLARIAAAGLIVAAVAVVVLAVTGPMTLHLALAVALGVFFTFLLGGGLFAVSFYSDTGGYDQDAATFGEGDGPPPDKHPPR